MGVLYTTSDVSDDWADLSEESEESKMHISELIRNNMTPLSAASMLLFILLYMPCISTIIAIKNESGKWKWALFTMAYTIGLAWIVSALFFQIGSLLI
jgi:ferrous iron transport protein B